MTNTNGMNFSDLSKISESLADATQTAGHSVVTVLTGGPATVSGTVVADGQVLTAGHVLHGDEVKVRTADGRELAATVAGRDPSTDLALLRIEGLNMPAMTASNGARVGELLLAVGRPMHGLQVTLGLMERAEPPQRGPMRGWLDAGAAPFRGVTGGALVDARGGLVGILNAGVSRGTLLAVPAARALRVAELLNTAGRVPRGYLGLATQPVHFPDNQQPKTQAEAGSDAPKPEERGGRGEHEPRRGAGRGERGGPMWDGRGDGRRDGRGWNGRGGPGWGGPQGFGQPGFGRHSGRVGLTVVQVEAGSPAAQAGLLVGDVLLALDGQAVRHPGELLQRVRERAGETLTVRVLRGGQETDVTVTVGER
ncbi:S1C family serine protease [Deinococcus sp. QL22]|uniref:S1C family serine protease n=1 Tax=Deinococcus sp. QL22 TaxID=2939437 RepID=UPI002017257C|nr:trypsin-like peptidase domain-containing protein [Deinococcus sp. QL22]UQN06167.1 S1C family serine protease [Deinococcus sp. QL22]